MSNENKEKNENEEVEELKNNSSDENATDLPVKNAEKHLTEIVNDMPEVVPEAVDAGKEALAAQQKQDAPAGNNGHDTAGLVDRYGRAFDANLHVVDETTKKPKLTSEGKLRVKANRSPLKFSGQGTETKGGPGPLNQPTANAPQIDQAAMKRRMAATVTATMFIQSGVAIFGDEWQPEKSREYNEQDGLIEATDEYFKVAGIVDMPPWLVLVVAYGSYGLKRMSKPRTQTVMAKMREAIWAKMVNFWLWLQNRGKKSNGARPNSGNHSNGQNHARFSTSAEIQKERNTSASS